MKKKYNIGTIDCLLILIGTPILSSITYCKVFDVKFIDIWYRINFMLWMTIFNGYSLNFIINNYKSKN